MKLWAGRFSKELDRDVNDFNASIQFDARMIREDIAGSIAHAEMLGKTGIIPSADASAIINGLQAILEDVLNGNVTFSEADEDVHMAVETLLTARIGEAGKRLHTARSRNDQVALDLRMLLRRESGEIRRLLLNLLGAIADTAEKHVETVMPGYTHLQRAQPTTYAHSVLAYAEMFKRDIGRLDDAAKRMDCMPLGSGAMGATTHPIDRFMVAELLGFHSVTQNSIDGVSDRDFVLELLSALSLIMMHLSRFSEEIILWCSHEFGFISLDDAYSTGSSIMPQKKNPDVAELVRGKTGRVYGDLFALLTVMKGLPLAYNKDMQEDKEAVFDAVDTVRQCLRVFTPMFASLTVHPDRMRTAAARGFINATDAADYLTRKGLPFRDAYTVTGNLVKHCIETGETLETLSLSEYRQFSRLFEPDIYASIDLLACVHGRNVLGGPAPARVREQITSLVEFIKEETP